MSYITMENITKNFGKNQVLNHINMEIEKGQFVTLLGPSGCGKSTLLRCLAGLEEMQDGKIFLDGEDITNTPVGKRSVGMVFQQYSLFPNMTVEQNIAFGLSMLKVDKDVSLEKIAKVIDLVELRGKEKAYPSTLSGGQQQRVALARSIVVEPKVLLLDEPLSAIDAKLRRSLQQRILEIHRELNLTTVFVTHDQDEAMLMSDVIHLFNKGQIEQTDTPVSMYTKPKTKFAAGFIGSYNILNGEEFSKLVGGPIKADMDIGIRPETIQLSKKPKEQEDELSKRTLYGAIVDDIASHESEEYRVKGIIKNSSPRGNVLRYQVDIDGIVLHADVLFRSFTLYENGTIVFVTIPKRDCLELE